LLQKPLKFWFKGISAKNLKSRKKGVGFLSQQNVSVGLKRKGFQHIAWEEVWEVFSVPVNLQQMLLFPSCLEMAAYYKKNIHT